MLVGSTVAHMSMLFVAGRQRPAASAPAAAPRCPPASPCSPPPPRWCAPWLEGPHSATGRCLAPREAVQCGCRWASTARSHECGRTPAGWGGVGRGDTVGQRAKAERRQNSMRSSAGQKGTGTIAPCCPGAVPGSSATHASASSPPGRRRIAGTAAQLERRAQCCRRRPCCCCHCQAGAAGGRPAGCCGGRRRGGPGGRLRTLRQQQQRGGGEKGGHRQGGVCGHGGRVPLWAADTVAGQLDWAGWLASSQQSPLTFVAAPSPGLRAVHGAVPRRQHPGRALAVSLGRLQLCVGNRQTGQDNYRQCHTSAAFIDTTFCRHGQAARQCGSRQRGKGQAGQVGQLLLLACRSPSIHSYMRRISASPNSSGQKKTSAERGGSRKGRQPGRAAGCSFVATNEAVHSQAGRLTG